MTSLLKFGLILFGFTMVGCAPSGFGYVSGTITVDGAPAPDLIVSFEPLEKGKSPSYGRTKSNGSYEMEFSVSIKGVQTGNCSVHFKTAPPEDHDNAASRPKYRIPKGLSEDGSDLTFDVKPGKQIFNYDIKTQDTSEPNR